MNCECERAPLSRRQVILYDLILDGLELSDDACEELSDVHKSGYALDSVNRTS